MSAVRPAPVRLQRTRGRVDVAFARRGAGSVLADLHQGGAARVRLPRVAAGLPPEAVLVNTAGGLTGGDRIDLSVGVGPGAEGCVTSQACEKVYRAEDGVAEVALEADLAAGARLAWLPQPAILFDRSAFRRRLAFDLAPDASLVAVEATILGRGAMGERMVHGRFDEHWRVRIDGRLAWAGAQRLRDPGRILGGPATLGGATASATIVCVDGDPTATLERLRSLLGAATGRSGASALGPVVVGMLLADGPRRLVEDLQRVIEGLLARPIPRVWTC